jgi:hypothetical protein
MDIYDETTQPLKSIWDNEDSRQKAKLVILKAIATVSEITVKQSDDIFDELDRMLLEEKEDTKKIKPQGL